MSVEGNMKCVKFLLFFFNFIFWLCGLVLIIVGILVELALHREMPLKDLTASGAPIFIVTIGVIVFFIAFFGCCGAWQENYCMINVFSILLFLIIMAEVGAAIAAHVFSAKVSVVIQKSLMELIEQYKSNTENVRDTVDHLQKNMKCCGVSNSSDWRGFLEENMTVPDSCCINVSHGCGHGVMMDATKVYTLGCRPTLEILLQKNILWVVVVPLVIAFLQMLGMVLACVLMREIRNE